MNVEAFYIDHNGYSNLHRYKECTDWIKYEFVVKAFVVLTK